MGQAGAEPRGRGGPEAMTIGWFRRGPGGPTQAALLPAGPHGHALPAQCGSLPSYPFRCNLATQTNEWSHGNRMAVPRSRYQRKKRCSLDGRVSTAVYSKGIIIRPHGGGPGAIIADAVMTATVTVATEKMRNRPPFQGDKATKALSPCSFSRREEKLMNRCLFVLCIWASVASAHIGTRVFPFYELTDEMLETIDIHDGSVEEWYQIGEPSMTLLDFKQGNDDLDPSDLDFRIWLAWHDESNRIYAAVTTIDDLYYNEHNYITEEGPGNMFYYDSILFTLDADHSGGTGRQV